MRSLVVLCAVLAAARAAAAPERVVKRSVGHVAYAAPAAVSHQSRVDIHSSPAVVTEEVVAPVVDVAPVVEARAVYTPTVYAAPAAVSHQSRVDFRSSPAVASVVTEPVLGRAVYSAPTQYYGGSAVTHQSRVDVHSSPAVYSEQVVAPAVVEARSAWAPSVYAATW